MNVMTFAQLEQMIEESGRVYNMEGITAAYELALEAHGEQARISGEPYISHPVSVASILVGLGMDSESITAALLHDVVEDTPTSLEEIQKQFGKDVALLVDGVTKIGKLSFETKEEQQQENVRKMLLAMNKDIRVIIIKLADRLHNMRTLDAMTPAKQRLKARETLDVYAPIAHRLGIRAVKEELEDLSLRYLDPFAYQDIEENLEREKEEREALLASIREKIETRIAEEGIEGKVEARVKSIYGIFRKMYMQGRSFDEIYDVYAIRVIVDTVVDCYTVLGVAHDMFRPIPNRFKDYISTPKPNMYQSLHTTLLGKEGVPFEIQIRTWDMHHTAELGIAAHWKYKAGIQGKDSLEERIAWVRQLLESDQEDQQDFVRSIKTDLAPEEVFVFTPRGDVKILPAGATIIDFAYAIHSEVGNRLVGGKVNNRIMNIDHEVQTGEIIEILTSNSANQGPSRDWLNRVKTSEARNKIRAWFKKEKREENIERGQEELEKEFRRNLIRLTDEQEKEFVQDIAKRQRLNTIEELYAAIGYGGVQLSKIMPRIRDDYQRIYHPPEEKKQGDSRNTPSSKPKKTNSKVSSGVIVEGLDGVLVKFAQCCTPVPGDPIIGFITRGFGVSIHKQDCSNVTQALADGQEHDRWVSAYWANEIKENFRVTLEILSDARSGVLAGITIQLANLRLAIHELNARELKDGSSSISLNVSINDLDQLQSVINLLGRIPGVKTVKRSGK